MTLAQRLFMLVAIALLPAIVIQGYNELDLRRSREAEVRGLALDQARLAASELDRILEGVRSLLVTVAAVPAVRALDTPACNAFLAALQPQVPYLLGRGARPGRLHTLPRPRRGDAAQLRRPVLFQGGDDDRRVRRRALYRRAADPPSLLPLALPLREGEDGKPAGGGRRARSRLADRSHA
ncbi:MAG: hypothetical protein U1E53_29960 [Dongiaceae bacterium]